MDKRYLKLKNEIGNRYGRWLVVSRGESRITGGMGGSRRKRDTYWVCRCDCGVEKEVKGNSLRSGVSSSCGCFQADFLRLPGDETAINRRVNSLKQSARRRGIIFDLLDADVKEIIIEDCFYCGESANPVNSIDRKDSRSDYVKENCVACCWPCNSMKASFSVTEFLDGCKNIVEILGNRIQIENMRKAR